MTKKVIKAASTSSSLCWKCFGLYNKDREFYTYKNKYVRDYISRSIRDGRVRAYNRFFESEQFEGKLITIIKHLNIYDYEISIVIDKYSIP